VAENLSSKASAGSRLSGKIAVVTGGTRGIGLAIANAFASENCSVVISGRNQQTLDQAAAELRANISGDSRVMPVLCDVRNAEQVEQMFAGVRREFGRLDILVNNAGISQGAAPVHETSVELWRDIIDTNLTGTFLCIRSAVPLMKRGATIVNILSVAARESFAGYTPYNASKAGALSLTRTLREELKASGIRVTAISPGATDTDIWQQVAPNAPREKMMEADSVAAIVLEAVVLSPKANLTDVVLDPVAGAL
jgi:NAD(P)-dependent dehydrogenase (short-subunit alcohol dehydrogenase family)